MGHFFIHGSFIHSKTIHPFIQRSFIHSFIDHSFVHSWFIHSFGDHSFVHLWIIHSWTIHSWTQFEGENIPPYICLLIHSGEIHNLFARLRARKLLDVGKFPRIWLVNVENPVNGWLFGMTFFISLKITFKIRWKSLKYECSCIYLYTSKYKYIYMYMFFPLLMTKSACSQSPEYFAEKMVS